jgi:hypothetical protein
MTDLYLWCWRQGMTQAETARHMGVSRASVSAAAKRLHLSFAPYAGKLKLDAARQIEFAGWSYPWGLIEVGDYFEARSPAPDVAKWASKRFAPKDFRPVIANGQNYVARAA